MLSNVRTVESEITDIIVDPADSFIIINNDDKKRFSKKEDVLVFKDNKYVIVTLENLKIGDYLATYSAEDNVVNHTMIKDIKVVRKDTNVLLFYREPYGMMIAGGMLAYNGCPSQVLTNP